MPLQVLQDAIAPQPLASPSTAHRSNKAYQREYIHSINSYAIDQNPVFWQRHLKMYEEYITTLPWTW
jgi:hypothetical protein